MDWFAFNNRTDIEQKHLGVFECIRLTLLPDKELDRILISMRQLPAAQSLVIDAKEANEYAAQAQQRQTAIRFKRGTVLRSECRAQLMAASGAAPAWILRLGNPALVNFVKMRADGIGKAKRTNKLIRKNKQLKITNSYSEDRLHSLWMCRRMAPSGRVSTTCTSTPRAQKRTKRMIIGDAYFSKSQLHYNYIAYNTTGD